MSLGVRYEAGYGVSKDPAIAAAWFEKAAEGGLAAAQWRLGLAYLEGWGVEEDPERGVHWLLLSGAAVTAPDRLLLEAALSRLPAERRAEVVRGADAWRRAHSGSP